VEARGDGGRTNLDSECSDAGADLGQVERSLLVEGLRGECGRVWDAVLLDELREHGNTFSLSHDLHRFDLGWLEGLVSPVDLSRQQLINQPIG